MREIGKNTKYLVLNKRDIKALKKNAGWRNAKQVEKKKYPGLKGWAGLMPIFQSQNVSI